ncbi:MULTISPECIES: hypothetical protein [unclassified Shinella]|uniref:ABC transporter ATP-binding protein n=2 Tax=unclassified Shinella TaxID=2643062 RepID=UPI00234F7323|nr:MULTISPECIES: hypothetical protein [unclassified Shinella]
MSKILDSTTSRDAGICSALRRSRRARRLNGQSTCPFPLNDPGHEAWHLTATAASSSRAAILPPQPAAPRPRRVAPLHPYTEMLLEAAPGLRKDHYVSRPPAFPASRAMHGVGCPLAGRCPRQVGNLCAEARPPVHATKNGFIRCHLTAGELATHTAPAKTPSRRLGDPDASRRCAEG